MAQGTITRLRLYRLQGQRPGQGFLKCEGGQLRRAEGGQFVNTRDDHGTSGRIGKKLAEIARAADAAIDGNLPQRRIDRHRPDDFRGPQGDAFHQGLLHVAACRCARHAYEETGGGLVPVRAAEPGKRRHEGKAAIDGGLLIESIEFRRIIQKADPLGPVDGRPRGMDATVQRIGGLAADGPCDGRQEPGFRIQPQMRPAQGQGECTGAESDLGIALDAAAMAIKRRLLIDDRSRHRHAVDPAEIADRRQDRRQAIERHAEERAEPLVPLAGADIHECGA
ncbi:hypothetical protein D3C71_1278790 [compost metagenome]